LVHLAGGAPGGSTEALGMMPQRRSAAARRADHAVVAAEGRLEVARQRSCRVQRAAVGQNLAAAGLLCWHLRRHSLALQQLQTGEAHVGIELVDVARNEQGHAHRARAYSISHAVARFGAAVWPGASRNWRTRAAARRPMKNAENRLRGP